MRGRWTDNEMADALAMGEQEFLDRYTNRNAAGLRQQIEKMLAAEGQRETYSQWRVRHAIQRQEEAAEAAGVSQKSFSRAEAGATVSTAIARKLDAWVAANVPSNGAPDTSEDAD